MKKAIADIHLYTTEDGGRQGPTRHDFFACPVYFKEIDELADHAYDCRLLIGEFGRRLIPGDRVSGMPMAFLSPDIVFRYIRVGTNFSLWSGGFIGEGVITDLP